MELDRLRSLAALARWLGPWTKETSRPTRTLRRRVRIDGSRPFDAWIYEPRGRVTGSLLVVPGLHYLGPADPRLDRFLAILAEAGLLVLCPFLPELRVMRVGPSLVGDAALAFEALRGDPRAPGSRPGVFSVSFGSYPAVHLAASEEHGRSVGALISFGGYASFEDVIRFSLEGDPDRPHDPLNRPVAFLNLLEHLDDLPPDPEPLRRAWIRYVRSTWGQPPMKLRENHEPVARAIASRLLPDAARLFLIGAGVEPGGPERIRAALARGHGSLAHLDLRDACAKVRAPVTIVHGRDDDVIPHTHAAMLADAMPPDVPKRVLLTGLYSHTGHGGFDVRALADEARALLGILEAVVDGARMP